MDKLVEKCTKALSKAEASIEDIAEALPLMRGRLDAILPIIIPIIKEAVEGQRTPRTDLENALADKEYAKLYRRARIKTQREIALCLETRKTVAEELNEELRVGNILTAKLTDKCRELELKLSTQAEEIKNWLIRKVYADGLLIPHSIIEAINTEWCGKPTGKGEG